MKIVNSIFNQLGVLAIILFVLLIHFDIVSVTKKSVFIFCGILIAILICSQLIYSKTKNN